MKRPMYANNAGRGAGTGVRLEKRTLDRGEVLARQAHWHAEPASAARTRALTTIRNQLRSIANRVENRT